MVNKQKNILDSRGERFILGKLLGEGGQGAVYAIEGGRLAAKIINVRGVEATEKLQRSITRVRALPLEGLPIARPLRVLAGEHVGYLMELMTDLIPLGQIAQVPPELAGKDFGAWYLKTGGLLRRLRLLARLAEVLAELHGRGLSYGDLSPSNVFISNDLNESEVWLIDCDNIRAGVNPRAVYTPGYGAPELMRGQHPGTDSLTDAWSLAVTVFETLCILSPFQGDLVHDGEPELEEQAARGELPWVDEEGGENFTDRGLPRPMVMNRMLRQLAEHCFGLSRNDRLARPGVAAWAEALHAATDLVVLCPQCTSSYYINFKQCPWCDASPPCFVLVNITQMASGPDGDIIVQDAAGKPRRPARFVVQRNHPASLLGRHLGMLDKRAVWCTFHLEDDALQLDAQGGAEEGWELRGHHQPHELAGLRRRLHLKHLETWTLRPQRRSTTYRHVSFELFEEA